MDSESYRQYIPGLNPSIEHHTQWVPDDGKYHVLRDGEILRSFRSLKQAQALYREIIHDSGYKSTPPANSKTESEIMTDRYLAAKDLYWADSYKHRGGGGQGGRGGV
jgi:hypothetical protein